LTCQSPLRSKSGTGSDGAGGAMGDNRSSIRIERGDGAAISDGVNGAAECELVGRRTVGPDAESEADRQDAPLTSALVAPAARAEMELTLDAGSTVGLRGECSLCLGSNSCEASLSCVRSRGDIGSGPGNCTSCCDGSAVDFQNIGGKRCESESRLRFFLPLSRSRSADREGGGWSHWDARGGSGVESLPDCSGPRAAWARVLSESRPDEVRGRFAIRSVGPVVRVDVETIDHARLIASTSPEKPWRNKADSRSRIQDSKWTSRCCRAEKADCSEACSPRRAVILVSSSAMWFARRTEPSAHKSPA
jgi:hypothetical protein